MFKYLYVHLYLIDNMNNAKIIQYLTLGLLICSFILPIAHGSDLAQPVPPILLPTDPVTIVLQSFPDNWDSVLKIEITGIAGEYDVTNGPYNGWCVEYGTETNNGPYNVILRSSYDPPAHLQNENWSKINYILNHKQGNRVDIQRAIWYFINFGSWEWDHQWGPFTTPVAQETFNMIENATLYCDQWFPTINDTIAVICDQGENWPDQLTFIEVELAYENVIVEKSVHYNCNGPWNDTGITIDLSGPNNYTWCTFRINVTNIVDIPLNIKVKDVLPDGLANGNHYYPFKPNFENESTIIWYLDGTEDHYDLLQPGETITFGIRAEMGNCGVRYINNVYVTATSDESPTTFVMDDAYVEWINCPEESQMDNNQSTCDRGFPIRYSPDGDWCASQDFTSNLDTLTDISIYMRKFGVPEFNLNLELRKNHPTGELIDIITLKPEQIPEKWSWVELDFEDISITAGAKYFIVCSAPKNSDIRTSFGYQWGYSCGDIYDNGSFWFSRNGGKIWRDLPDKYDYCFRTYGQN